MSAPPFHGDWRSAAPTLPQVSNHSGAWWRWHAGSWPWASLLARQTLRDGDAVVFDGECGTMFPAVGWDAVYAEEWRDGALVCPCDANGAPIAWPREVAAS